MRHRATMHAGPIHVLVTIRDVSPGGLLVEADYLIDIGEEAILENKLVNGATTVRVVRHTTTPSGRMAMGLQLVSLGNTTAGDGSGLFRLI